jgi:hypothetical protein
VVDDDEVVADAIVWVDVPADSIAAPSGTAAISS